MWMQGQFCFFQDYLNFKFGQEYACPLQWLFLPTELWMKGFGTDKDEHMGTQVGESQRKAGWTMLSRKLLV